MCSRSGRCFADYMVLQGVEVVQYLTNMSPGDTEDASVSF